MPKELFYEGPNHCVDIIVVSAATKDVLLITRGGEAGHNCIALPGGFVDSGAAKGGVFTPDVESWREAAARELREETGIECDSAKLLPLPARQGPLPDGSPRDPRETATAYTVDHPFLLIVDNETFISAAAGDDAKDMLRVPLSDAADMVNFSDHRFILQDAAQVAVSVLSRPMPVQELFVSGNDMRAGQKRGLTQLTQNLLKLEREK